MDSHGGTEAAAFDRQALSGEGLGKAFIKRTGLLGCGGADEAGPVTLARVGGLNYPAYLKALYDAGATITLNLNLKSVERREPGGDLFVVFGHGADQHQKARADFAHGLVFDLDAGLAHALDQGFHDVTLGSRHNPLQAG
jgi:hypothetical protein